MCALPETVVLEVQRDRAEDMHRETPKAPCTRNIPLTHCGGCGAEHSQEVGARHIPITHCGRWESTHSQEIHTQHIPLPCGSGCRYAYPGISHTQPNLAIRDFLRHNHTTSRGIEMEQERKGITLDNVRQLWGPETWQEGKQGRTNGGWERAHGGGTPHPHGTRNGGEHREGLKKGKEQPSFSNTSEATKAEATPKDLPSKGKTGQPCPSD
eukprot:TRINITY_DN17830_c0_g1_i2.p2 TRINITY_DN17830_c0_g1~~TRINITY_DN17830_c0_g1_i2.p2  ORF type:complete len:211 (-),score=14.19 TRINITY_DN17830_c0_g1_i2:333-965(-)